MADNYLERHREEYEQRKAAYERKRCHMPKARRDRSELTDCDDGL